MNHNGKVILTSAGAPGNGTGQSWNGGRGLFMVEGNFGGGGSVKLQTKTPNSTTWVDVPNASLTANGMYQVEIPGGQVRSVVATATAVYAYLLGIPQ